MKNKNLFNRKGLKSFRSFLRDKATAAESTNQPPRPQTDFAISDFNCTAAAPPSKANLCTHFRVMSEFELFIVIKTGSSLC